MKIWASNSPKYSRKSVVGGCFNITVNGMSCFVILQKIQWLYGSHVKQFWASSLVGQTGPDPRRDYIKRVAQHCPFRLLGTDFHSMAHAGPTGLLVKEVWFDQILEKLIDLLISFTFLFLLETIIRTFNFSRRDVY